MSPSIPHIILFLCFIPLISPSPISVLIPSSTRSSAREPLNITTPVLLSAAPPHPRTTIHILDPPTSNNLSALFPPPPSSSTIQTLSQPSPLPVLNTSSSTSPSPSRKSSPSSPHEDSAWGPGDISNVIFGCITSILGVLALALTVWVGRYRRRVRGVGKEDG